MKTPRISFGKLVFMLLIFAAVIAAGLLIWIRPEVPEAQPPKEDRVAVSVINIEPANIDDLLELPGRVEPGEDLLVAVEQAGRIVSINVREGDRVARGDKLLQVDNRLWHTQLRNAELRERDARLNLARMDELRNEGAVSERDHEAAQTAAESALIAIEEARINLERCVPAAPIGGRIEQRRVSVGEYVSPGQPIFRLIDTDEVKVVFDVSERDIRAAELGGDVSFRLDAFPGTVFTGSVSFVAASAGRANNAYRVELTANNSDGNMRAGMLARIDFLRGRLHDTVLLPLQAIVPMEGETVVYVLEDNRAGRRIVRIAKIVDAMAVLSDGVRPGEQVILDGNRQVVDGTPVTVMSGWKPAPMPGTGE